VAEEESPKNSIELFDPKLEYLVRESLNKLRLHSVAVEAQAINERVDAGSGFVVPRIHERARGDSAVWQFDLLNRKLAVPRGSGNVIALLLYPCKKSTPRLALS